MLGVIHGFEIPVCEIDVDKDQIQLFF